MRFYNGLIYKKDFTFHKCELYTEGRLISRESSDGKSYDLKGFRVIPGLIDIHLHGAVGHDFMEGTSEALSAIAAYEAKEGITTLCPATMTMPYEDILKVCRIIRDFIPDDNQASIAGINMEGPFFAKDKAGAQNPAFLKLPDINFVSQALKESGNLIKIVNLAPELDGAIDFINKLSSTLRISIAHTCCDYETAVSAINAGACHIAHIFNAMPALMHRNPGPIAAGADNQNCTAEIILDGCHIHPAAARCAFRLFGIERMILISDSMMAAGLPDGNYELGGQCVSVKERRASLDSGVLAGSASNLFDCLKQACFNVGISLEHAVRAATYNPALAIGILDNYGTLEAGKTASFVIIDDELDIKAVILRGKFIKNNL